MTAHMSRLASIPLVCVCVAVSATCAGDRTGASVLTPATVAPRSGAGQTAVVGTPLAEPLVVAVAAADGEPVPDVAVAWRLVTGDGTLSTANGTTDSLGLAAVSLTLGPTAGADTVTATVARLGTPARFGATALPDVPATLAPVSGDSQQGLVGEQLPESLVVAVSDRFGNARAGTRVDWTVTAGGGAVSAAAVTTDSAGHAAVAWTLGTAAAPGADSLAAAVDGLAGSPVRFGASASAGPPDTLRLAAGDDQTGTVGSALPESLAVVATDRFGNPVAGVAVTWSVAAGGGTLSGQSVATDSSGRSQVQWTLGPIAGTQRAAATLAGAAGSPRSFSAAAQAAPPARLTVSAGNGQTAPAGTQLAVPLAVRVSDTFGNVIAGATVSWTATAGAAVTSPTQSVTDSTGIARTTCTLGAHPGTQAVQAGVVGLADSTASFSATATPNGTISGTVSEGTGFLTPPPPTAATTTSPATVRYVPNELIVTYRAAALGAPPIGAAAATARAAAAAVASQIRGRLASRPLPAPVVVRGVSPAVLAARLRVSDSSRLQTVAAALRHDPAIASVERDQLVHLAAHHRALDGAAAPSFSLAGPDDSLYPYQAWDYDMIDAPRAWAITTGSATALVAVVDVGIRYDHPAIAANLTHDGYDFVSQSSVRLCQGGTIDNAGDGDGYDPDPTAPADYDYDVIRDCVSTLTTSGDHGLHVAGTIGAVGNDGIGTAGVAWTVRIRPVRVLGVAGYGSFYDIAQGILYAAGLPADDGSGGTVTAPSPARVINLSLGGSSGSTALHNAVIDATAAGALVVAAAGNAGGASVLYPAAYPEALAVSAVDPYGVLTSYSSSGSAVDIAAPGGDYTEGGPTFSVMSTVWNYVAGRPAYDAWDGTSMATPHVTGVAALLLAQDPTLSVAGLRARLTDWAVDAGPPGPDDHYGAGIVNARNSLTQSFAPAARPYARLFDAQSGAPVATAPVAPDGGYAFTALADGPYYVFAGSDEDGDGQIGVPGRPWGADGGSATPVAVTVDGAGTYGASFSVALPGESEPNDDAAHANWLALPGYLNGTFSSNGDVDVFRVRIAATGVYTFETSGQGGACGFALEANTAMTLSDSTGAVLATNDDIDSAALHYCSRITRTLAPGVYDVAVRASGGWRYRLAARAAP